jgi:hypothetical protein
MCAGFSFYVTFHGFTCPFADAFFLRGMPETTMVTALTRKEGGREVDRMSGEMKQQAGGGGNWE